MGKQMPVLAVGQRYQHTIQGCTSEITHLDDTVCRVHVSNCWKEHDKDHARKDAQGFVRRGVWTLEVM